MPNLDINYGLGDRIQLKYELPWVLQETRGAERRLIAGLGNSLLGVKWRFYEHTLQPASQQPGIKFSLSTYPQLSLNNPTRSAQRGLVDPSAQFLLPLEANATIGPLRVVAEVGYTFASRGAPNSWLVGVMAGHEFKKFEAYLEFHDQGDVTGTERETTLGVGGRRPLNSSKTILFMGMVGRSLSAATLSNDQPQYIAYAGLQFRLAMGSR